MKVDEFIKLMLCRAYRLYTVTAEEHRGIPDCTPDGTAAEVHGFNGKRVFLVDVEDRETILSSFLLEGASITAHNHTVNVTTTEGESYEIKVVEPVILPVNINEWLATI